MKARLHDLPQYLMRHIEAMISILEFIDAHPDAAPLGLGRFVERNIAEALTRLEPLHDAISKEFAR